jgi:ribonuclease G
VEAIAPPAEGVDFAERPDVEVISEIEVRQGESAEAAGNEGGRRRRRRGRGNRGGNFPESKYADPDEPETEAAEEVIGEEPVEMFEEEIVLLPGETRKRLQANVPRAAAAPPASASEDEDESGEESVSIEPVAEPAAPHLAESHISAVHVVTPASMKADEEAAVLEEVKEHLAEIAREKEEERDFEEAERLDHPGDSAGNAQTEAADEDEETPESEENGNGVIVENETNDDGGEAENLDLAEAEDEEVDEEVDEEDVEDASAESVVLPALGYSAHLRQNDSRDSQEGGDGADRVGRRRRRGRGKDRPLSRAAEPQAANESVTAPLEGATAEVTLPGEARGRDRRGERREERRDDRRGTRGEESRPERRDDRRDRPDDRRERRSAPSITELLREGQEILVQIAKEPLGQKGARITSHIALPGRYCVYMPTVEHTGVSRKIGSDEERARLKRVLQSRRDVIPGGFIIRTAGEGRPEADLLADMEFLHNLWLDIRRKAEAKPAPSLIYHDLEIVERVLRDQVGPEFKSIWVDSEEAYENVLRFLERFQPAMVSRVRMYTRQAPIFDSFGISAELEKALRPKVWLKSGGYIVINQTEALVAIDINTGKFVGRGNKLEDTIVKTNVEAIKEIVRQIRLRDLGGIIVIDFIDMDERKNRLRVMQALEEAMRSDRAPYKILQFNDFGLVAITRKRVKQSLERTLCSGCPYCEGSGYVKSVQTVIGEVLNEAKKLAPAVADSKDVMLRVNPEVAKILKSTDNQFHEEIEEILGRPVLVVSDPLIHQEQFDLA